MSAAAVATGLSFACLLSMLPGPPGVQYEEAYFQVLPIDKTKCPYINPKRDITFELFTRYNPIVSQQLVLGDDEGLANSNLDFGKPTVLYFHAFFENSDSESATLIREAYILRGDTNVILVDAMRLEAGPWYPKAVENTAIVGLYTAQFIDYLVSRGMPLSRVHLIGLSLGAQMAGVAGMAVGSGQVARITGLDPALPLFPKLPLWRRLDHGDAEFVDIIHTDAGIFGITKPMGHVDFYPNGGISPQPGCELEVLWPRMMTIEKCSNGEIYHVSFDANTTELTQPKKTTDKKFQQAYSKMTKAMKQNGEILFRVKSTKKIPTKLTRIDYLLDIFDRIPKENCKGVGYKTKVSNTPKKYSQNTGKPTAKNLISSLKTSKPMEQKTTANENAAITPPHSVETTNHNAENPIPQSRRRRYKRSIFSLFNRQNTDTDDRDEKENNMFILNVLKFMMGARRGGFPVVSIFREVNTRVQSPNGKIKHHSKERNAYFGTDAPNIPQQGFNLQLRRDPPQPMRAFVKRLLGRGDDPEPGANLSIMGLGGNIK